MCDRCGLPLIPDGLGTALKPAYEPIVVARKPLIGTVAGNVERYGTGALNIDGCRIGYPSNDARLDWLERYTGDYVGSDTGKIRNRIYGQRPSQHGGTPSGRWPANVVLSHHDDCREVGTRRVKASQNAGASFSRGIGTTSHEGWQRPAHRNDEAKVCGYGDADGYETVTAWECVEGCPVRMLDEQSGETGTHGGGIHRESRARRSDFGLTAGTCTKDAGGGASRFYYVAKASRSERGEGNNHPCVKPISLCRWLVRLVTPCGGVVLDPFLGSGSTGVAAIQEGFDFLGIEREADYATIARKRLAHVAGDDLPLLAGAP